MLKVKFKYIFIRSFLSVFKLFPIKTNYIFLSAYEGKQYSCNPKYIFLKLLEKYSDKYFFVWEYNNNIIPNDLKRNNVKIVRHNSIAYIYYIMRSKYLITNSGISGKFPLRKKQININTWHGGGAYKKVGLSYSEQQSIKQRIALEYMYKQTNYFLSSSQMFTEIMSSSLNYSSKKFLSYGMPRNDILFNLDNKSLVNRVKENLGLDENSHIVLYAPTYRGNIGNTAENKIEINYQMVLNTLIQTSKTENWYFLYRGHYYMKSNIVNNINFINVSDYPDMQELLYVADILITDYSSSIWDYSFTNRPCYLFVPDLESYLNNRGFYTDINTWPGIVCRDNNELRNNIENFDKNLYRDKIISHHDLLGNFETGEATEKIIDLLS